MNNESTLKTQLYIIEGRAAGHTARLDGRAAAQALGELELGGGAEPPSPGLVEAGEPAGSRGQNGASAVSQDGTQQGERAWRPGATARSWKSSLCHAAHSLEHWVVRVA